MYYRWVAYFVQEGEIWIQQKAKTDEDKLRRCHAGIELVPYDQEFFVILSPLNHELSGAYQKLFQSGIIQNWSMNQRN